MVRQLSGDTVASSSAVVPTAKQVTAGEQVPKVVSGTAAKTPTTVTTPKAVTTTTTSGKGLSRRKKRRAKRKAKRALDNDKK
jgi:hypothetical protein